MIKHIAFVASEPERAIGLEDYLPNFHIITVPGNISAQLRKQPNAHVISTENQHLSTSELLVLPETKEVLTAIAPEPKEIGIMVFKNDARIEKFCKENGYQLLNETFALNQRFERKINQYREFSQLGDLFPQTSIVTLSHVSVNELIEKFGLPFVLQYDRGHTGNSTIIVTRPETFEHEQQQFPNREARLSRFINGIPVTLNCCATKYGTLTSGLCIQMTGITECTKNLGTTVGNDWASINEYLTTAQISEINRISTVVGNFMYQQGYKGMFGCDLIVTDERVFLIEVNARQTASVGLHTKLLLERKQLPLSLYHIAEFAGDEALVSLLPTFSQAQREAAKLTITNEPPFIASQLIVRNTADNSVRTGQNFASGVYNNRGEYVDSEYNFRNLQKDQMLIYVALHYKPLAPEDEIFRIIHRGPTLRSLDSLLPTVQSLVETLKSSIEAAS